MQEEQFYIGEYLNESIRFSISEYIRDTQRGETEKPTTNRIISRRSEVTNNQKS